MVRLEDHARIGCDHPGNAPPARETCVIMWTLSKIPGPAERPTAPWIILGLGDGAAVRLRLAMSIQEWVSGRADQSCACC